LAAAPVRRIDYGVARFCDPAGVERVRPFLNVASAGISGRVDQLVDGASRAMGTVATYVTASLRAIASHENAAVELQFDDEEPRVVDLSLVCVANGCYMGGGMWISPPAALDDGRLHTVLLAGFSRARLCLALARVFGGRHLGWGGVEDRKVERVRVRPLGQTRVPIDLDGEQPGTLPAEFRVEAGGLLLQAPAPDPAT
jgi:diacylglycerol kinase family enzyme